MREYISDLPDLFWMTELSLPNLYAANKRKIGECLIRVDQDDQLTDQPDDNPILLIRVPGVAVRRREWGGFKWDSREKPRIDELSFAEHSPLLRLSRDVPDLEW